MAWSFVNAATTINGAGSVVVNKPTGTLQGDIMVAQICNVTQNTAPAGAGVPTGWTALDPVGNATVGWWTGLYYKVAGASEGASYTWTAAGTLDGGIESWRGGNTTTPIDQHVGSDVGSTATPTSASVNDTNAGDEVIYFCANDSSNLMTKPTGTTQPYNTDCISSANKVLAGSGATGTGAWAITSSPCIVHTVSLNLAAAADPFPAGYFQHPRQYLRV